MMRTIRIAGLIALGLALGYYYRGSQPFLAVQRILARPCSEPVLYTVGDIDPEFGISREEVTKALQDAESLWEQALGRDLFTLSATTSRKAVAVQFIYDERQANTTRESSLRETLADERSEIATMQDQRDVLVTEYEALLEAYNKLRVDYEKKLATYNKEVNSWNAKGGAPAEVYEQLTRDGAVLDHDMQDIVGVGNELKQLVTQLNTYGEAITKRVAAYNKLVATYNTDFHDHVTFTQGTYGDRSIDIYQYGTSEDLRIVLAHELGHALGFGHVEGDMSIMYEKTGSQTLKDGLSQQDIAHAKEVCGVN